MLLRLRSMAASLLVLATSAGVTVACGADDGDSETATATTMTTTTVGESDSGTTEGDDTTAAHDGSTSDHGSTGADPATGSETGPNACDELGSTCHDIETPEAQECHEIGHAAEVMACEAAYEMCAKICGL